MRISDWSSDVCSSDLQASAPATRPSPQPRVRRLPIRKASPPSASHSTHAMVSPARSETATAKGTEVQKTSGGTSSATIVAVGHEKIGKASSRESGGQYV